MIKNYESKNFTLEKLLNIKSNKKIYVVFSTFGEREADLIFQKISLIKNKLENFVDEIFLSHRRTGNSQDKTESMALKAYNKTKILICNDYKVPDKKNEKGKGADMRRMLHYINKNFFDKNSNDDIIIVFLDADVVEEYFGTHFVLALAGAILEGNDFAKASFWRAMGRVKKFVAQPLFSLIEHEKLNELQKMAYPLSGEVAGTLTFFNNVSFWQMYGVETGINIEAVLKEKKIADVNLGLYDHEHNSDLNIQKMSFGIMKTFFKQLLDFNIIELKDEAKLSDFFKASYIDDKKARQPLNFDLTEKKYPPLSDIL